MKVLVITNLFGYPWDVSRGTFNQQQFDQLAKHVELEVLVAVPWRQALRRPRAYWAARRTGRKRWPYVDYFIFWYLPGWAQSLHAVFFFLSLLLQKPGLLLRKRRQALVGSWGFPDAVAAAALGHLTKTPVLMKVHGTDVNDYLQNAAKRWQILAAAKRCRAVMTPSRALRAQLVQAGVAAHRVKTIYNGIDVARFQLRSRETARAELGLSADEQLLLFVGNLKLTKGCADLLEAYISLVQSQSQTQQLTLAFVGDGPARSTMQQRVRACGLVERVRFVGKLDHALLPQWFTAAQLLCLPSHNEGVPNVVLEAMACGTPVVATCVGGIPEVVPQFAGVLVAPHDTKTLSAALQTALSTKWDNARISAHAHGFTWQANIAQVLTLLSSEPSSQTPELP
jgi:glycosyltransferase involved in cell wall biosynthesis